MSQNRYAYLIGANGPQTDRLAMLKYAEKDAQRLAEALRTSHCAFTDAEATIAENPQPTLAGLNRFVKQCEPSDLLLVHFSGHADRGRGGQLILLCNGTDIDDYTSSAIKISSIKEYLDECKARQKVLILDCCHAGAAHTSPFKGDQDLRSSLQQMLEGSVNIILSACSYRDRTRELAILDDGAGFLSWALTTACTSHFQELSPDGHSLSLMDIWQWIPTALQGVNDRLGPKEQLPQPILLSEMKAGDDSEIWLTEQRRAHTSKYVPDQLTRKKYLESVYKRYSSVKLPLGPEGFSLHAIFQPLELRRDPLAAEDLDRQKRRPFLGERLENEKDADLFRLERDEKEHADEKQRPVIAENGEDALTKSPQHRVVVLGGPGTGKTTTLKHFVGCRAKEALTDPNAPIPIFLSLADLARSQKTLQSYLVGLVEELGIERTYAETLWKAIEAGQAFVCLDSLDEVEPQRRQKMIEWVNAWAAESGNTWVVGSRFTEYKNGSFKHGRFAEWELLPMERELRLELAEHLLPELQRLLQNIPEKSLSPATFVKLLEDHPRAAAWGENPLLFSLAAVVFLRTGGLPSSRAMLYREVIDAILKTREASLVRCTVLLRLLSQFALWLHQKKGRVFTTNDLVSFLADSQGKSWEETESQAERMIGSGMMEPVARDTYGFRHQTFQEYLAAVELARQLTLQDRTVREEAWKLAWSKRMYSRWTEILRLMVGVLSQMPGNKGKSEAQHWLRELIGQRSTEEGDPGDLGLALALKSLTEITEENEKRTIATTQLQRDIVFTWLDELLLAARGQRETKQERLQSLVRDVFHLRGQEVDEVVKLLIEALWDQNTNIRDVANKVLQELGQLVPIDALLVALNDPDIGIRQAALQVLGRQGERVPVEPLLEALHDVDWQVRRVAVQVLGGQGKRVVLLLKFKDSWQMAAVQVLGGQGKRVSVEPLLEALHDMDWEVRRAAVQVLGGQGGRVPNTVNLRPKGGEERTESSKSGIMSERKKRRNFLVYRLRQMDVDDKICEQISPGVLEKIYPTEVIEQCVQGSDQWTGTQRRVRQSTALALVLFVIMLALWSRLNQRQVWQKFVGGLSKLHPENLLCGMSSSALTVRRGELGSQVMKALMQTCCQPIARREQTPEAFFGRYRLMAIDGTLFNVADVQVNEQAFGRSSNQFGKGAYPQVRCVLLAECGTHAVVGMQISRYDESEVHGSHVLLCLIGRSMLLLVDAGIISAGFVQAVRNRGGHVLASLPSGMWEKGPRRRLRDGSQLVQLKPNKRGCYPLNKPIWVRIISYRITDERLGEVGKVYRLVTTLLNPQTVPAKDLVILYHERWEIELVIDEVKTHERAQRKVLRSRTAQGVYQELYGIFLAHYAVRALMYEAACEAGVDPDRLSFTEGMFQLCETIPFAQIMQVQDAEPIRRRLQRDISAVILPPRLLRVNRREVKQVYNRHKPKKRNLPPPASFLPEQRFEDFVQMVDPLLPAQEEVPSAA